MKIALSRVLFVVLVAALIRGQAVRADELKRRGIMGVQLAPLSAEQGAEASKGVLVQNVFPNTPAQEAGLEAQDIVTKVGEVEVADVPSMLREARKYYAGDTLPLTIQRGKEVLTKGLKLTPRPKETSDDYEVMYDSISTQGLKLRTYVTKPKKEGKHPAVIFIPSPVPQSMEFAPQMAKHPFKLTMEMLTKSGIVTMRVDRPAIGDSEGEDAGKTPLALDVALYREGIKKLQTYDFVDPKNVYIFSFGMGSAVAPLVAEGLPVKGVLAYASTVVRPWSVGMVEQSKRGWWLKDEDDKGIEERAKKLAQFLELCQASGAKPSQILKDKPELKEAVDAIGGPVTDDSFTGIDMKYFQDIAAVNYTKAWTQVDAHVLSVWGEADYQANREDSQLIAEAVNRSHPGKAKFIALPEVDHGLNKADDQEDSYLSGYQGEFNPIVAETLVRFIEKTSRTDA